MSSLLFPELCLKESLCVGISSKLLLDVSGTQGSELDSIYSLNDRGRNINAVKVPQTGSATLALCFTLEFIGPLKFHSGLNFYHFINIESFTFF